MSRTTDRFRPPYGTRLVESPRQCVFAGTVNHSTYLRDETGGRRFWPVTCGRIDVEALARDRDQLWAEAKARFEAGSVWWLETAELVQLASDQQVNRYEGDPWEEVIAPWIETRSSVSISEVLENPPFFVAASIRLSSSASYLSPRLTAFCFRTISPPTL